MFETIVSACAILVICGISIEDYFLCIMLLAFLLVHIIRLLIIFGRTIDMDENGCTIKFLFFKARRYKWSEFKTICLEDNSQRLFGRGDPYQKFVVFSTREKFHTPELISIMTYLYFCLRPFRFFVVLFRPKRKFGAYGIDEELFRSKMKEFGVEVQK